MHPPTRLVPFVLWAHCCSKYCTKLFLLLERKCSGGKYKMWLTKNTKYNLRKIQNAICEKYKTVPAAAFGISAEKLQSWWAEKMHLWAQKVSLQRGRNKILFKYNMFWANWWQKHKIQMEETKCKIQFAWNTIYVHYFGWDELLSQSMKIILEGKIGNTICVKNKMQNVFLILGGRRF